MFTLIRLALAGALIIPATDYLTSPTEIPAFALYVALVLTVLFVSSLFRTRTEKGI
ncbi:MAG: hypothetical protein M3548_22845 [Actinomycetota bacterium]|nr:hypothetical protein [Actinomycetota bacterium]